MADNAGEAVVLHVYDLSGGMAARVSLPLTGKQLDGIWHTGVVVYGKEFFFGQGICQGVPGQTPYGHPLQTVTLGSTEITQDVFVGFLRDIAPRFTPADYHLMKHNCNTFSNEVSQFLTGNAIPEHITNLPNEIMDTPIAPMLGPFLEQVMGVPLGDEEAEADEAVDYILADLMTPVISSTTADLDRAFESADVVLSAHADAIHTSTREAVAALKPLVADEDGGAVSGLPDDALSDLVVCLSRLPESFAFPLLDVLRLVLAREDVAAHYAATPEDGDLLASLSAFAVRVDSRATAIMFLRAAMNAVGRMPPEATAGRPEVCVALVAYATAALDSADDAIRTAAAGFLYNMTIAATAPHGPDGDSETGAEAARSDVVDDIVMAVATHVMVETCEEALFRLLMTAGRLMRVDEGAIRHARSCGLAVGAFMTSPVDKVRQISTEVHALLKTARGVEANLPLGSPGAGSFDFIV